MVEMIIKKAYLDEGPEGWTAGAYDVTRQDTGLIDPKEIANLPGENGEHKMFAQKPTGRLTQTEWLAFCNDLRENGMQWSITIFKELDGRIHINEGNHRLRAALEIGMALVPVEIRYFGNSQRQGLVAVSGG